MDSPQTVGNIDELLDLACAGFGFVVTEDERDYPGGLCQITGKSTSHQTASPFSDVIREMVVHSNEVCP